MLFVVNGFDVSVAPGRPYAVRSGDNGSEWPTFEQVINDSPSDLSMQIVDVYNELGLVDGMEVIAWDDQAPPIYTFSGTPIPTVPGMNLLRNSLLPNSTNWTAAGTNAGLITYGVIGQSVRMTFSNSPVDYGLLYQNTLLNYVKPGQQYMLSVYVSGSGTIHNIQSIVKFDWYDIDGNLLSGGPSDYRTPPTAQTRVSISATAPANAAYAQVALGGQATSATNSGVLVLGTPQFEPMYFVAQGISYPTPDCNYAQTNCAQMPDGTISRMCRLFSGYIDDLQWNWEGGHRLWTLSVASAGMLLDNGPQINMSVSNIYDDQVISSAQSTYFSGLLSISAANQFAANPIVRGILVPSDSYSDKTFRDLLNGLSGQSGYNFYVDPYYCLHYNPQFYAAAAFGFSDQYDNITTFEMHDFSGESDGTSRKRNIKILGGNYLAPFVDSYTATAGQTIFNLTWQPKTPTGKVAVNGSGVNTGVYGVHDPTKYTVLVDKAGLRLVFTTGLSSGATVSYSYSYEAPVSCQVIDQDTSNPIPSPAYAQPPYFSQVHDTSITSLAGGTLRGIAELTAWSKSKLIYTFTANVYAQPGLIVYLTSRSDNVLNQPFVVTKVDASFLGNGINEYQYTVGAYQPSITDYTRYAYKAHQLSSTTANVTVPQNIDIVFNEFVAYSEEPTTYTVVAGPPYSYGAARYGYAAYG